ncbi:hypothetical protein D3C81_2206570 [compost metagenome]
MSMFWMYFLSFSILKSLPFKRCLRISNSRTRNALILAKMFLIPCQMRWARDFFPSSASGEYPIEDR